MACDSTLFVTDSAVYTTPYLNAKQQKTISIVALLYGQNISANLAAQIPIALAATKGMTPAQVKAATVRTWVGWANATGTPMPATIALKLAKTLPFQELSDEDLDKIHLYLLCGALGPA